MAVAAKPEVEIWRRPKNELFDPGFLFTPSDTFWLGRTVLPQYKTLQRDDGQTDGTQTRHCTIGSTDSTVGQKQNSSDNIPYYLQTNMRMLYIIGSRNMAASQEIHCFNLVTY